MNIQNIIGKPVSDQNFFGRGRELEELQAISEREHVLQVIFGALREHARTSQPTTEMLGAVIEGLLDRRTYFSYWDERLHDSLGAPSDAIARALLATCAQAPEGATPAAMSQAIAAQVQDVVERASAFKWIACGCCARSARGS